MESAEKQRFIRVIRKWGTISGACSELGMSRMRFYRTCDKDPIFRARVYKAKTDALLKRA